MLPIDSTKHRFVPISMMRLSAVAAALTLGAWNACGAAPAAPTAHPAAIHPVPTGQSRPHRSIWAARWAAANPAQEAAYRHSLTAHQLACPAPLHKVGPHAPAHACASARLAASTPIPLTPALMAAKPHGRITAAKATARLVTPGTASAQTPLVTGTLRQRRAAESTALSSDDVTLDFVAADINDVLKALAVQTGANIVSSTDVKGTVTVSLSHVSLEQALDMIARLSGYQYAKVNGTYVVGTAASIQAMTGGAGTGQAPITSVITFNYASLDDVSFFIKNRFPNITINTGTDVSGKKAGAGEKALILSGDATTIAQARDLIQQIDSKIGEKVAQQTTETYMVKYVSLPDLISILNSLVPSLIVTPGPNQGFATKAPSAAATTSSSTSAGVSSDSSGAPASASTGATGSGATGASQSSSTGPNLLLLTGTASDVTRARQILSQIDVQPAQILYETKVTEISDSDQRNIGLNWDFSGASTTIGEINNGVVVLGGLQPDPGTNTSLQKGVFPDYPGHVLKFGTLARSPITNLATVTLDALVANGRAHLLADPNIAAITGQPAQVFIGDTINYVQSITQSTTGENVTTASVQVGVILRVTGKAGPDGYITLNIHPEVSEITGYLSVPGGGSLPQIANRYADTTIRVKDGDTIAIGGLIQDNITDNVNKVPLLGDLPFFGQLFRDEKKNKTRTEVVFFLKTSVMKTT